jgi:hypothetical protein
MSNINNIDKNDCLKFIKNDDSFSIHPLLNTYYDYTKFTIFENKPDMCHVLPQLMKKKKGTTIITNIGINILKENIAASKTELNIDNINLSDDLNDLNELNKSNDLNTVDIKSSQNLKKECNDSLKCIDPALNFALAINKNNFLDIVFQITSIEDLNNWLFTNDLNRLPIEMINTVLDLFWENYYNKIDEDINLFIEINKKLIYVFFQEDLTIEIATKIVNRLIKNNYGKKIKYLSKIKKYLTKYI